MFKVVDGGSGSSDPPKKRRNRKFKPHKLSGFLWDAIKSGDERDVYQIAIKMTEASGQDVSVLKVHEVLIHVRKHSKQYGWTVLPVKKGNRSVLNKRYLVAQVNDDGTVVFDERHLEAAQGGMNSTARTVATMTKRASDGWYLLSEIPGLSPANKRAVEGAAAAMDVTRRMADEVLAKVFGLKIV